MSTETAKCTCHKFIRAHDGNCDVHGFVRKQAVEIGYPMQWRGGLLLGPTLIYINEDGIPIELRLNDEQVQMIIDDWNTREILDSDIGEEVDTLKPPIAA